MMEDRIDLEPQSEDRLRDLAPPALRTFFALAQVWNLNEHEQMKLLGVASPITLRAWKGGSCSEARPETIERISYLLGIFKAINILLPDQSRAYQWMRAPNAGEPFGGRSALDRMTHGSIDDLQAVRRHLEAQIG